MPGVHPQWQAVSADVPCVFCAMTLLPASRHQGAVSTPSAFARWTRPVSCPLVAAEGRLSTGGGTPSRDVDTLAVPALSSRGDGPALTVDVQRWSSARPCAP